MSVSALNFVINQPPSNGSCSISPLNGSTSTVFTVSCANWIDDDGIRDYILLGLAERVMVAFSPTSRFEVRLPAGDGNASLTHLVVVVRDQLGCVREVNLPTVTVVLDPMELASVTDQNSSNAIVRWLASGNQNIVGQVISSAAQQLNRRNDENLDDTPLTSIFVSPLGSVRSAVVCLHRSVASLDLLSSR